MIEQYALSHAAEAYEQMHSGCCPCKMQWEQLRNGNE